MTRLLALALVLPFLLHGGIAELRELVRSGQFGAALAACDAELRQRPGDYQVLSLKALALQGLGVSRRAEALATFRAALKIQPAFAPALQGAAQIEYETGDPRAAETLARLVAVRPETGAAHAMLAVLAFEKPDCVRGVRHVEAAPLAALATPLLRWQYAGCLHRLNRTTDAITQFRELLKVSDRPAVRFNLALLELEAGRAADAIALLEPVAASERDGDTLSLLAAAYEANKQTPQAIAALQRAIEIDPQRERHYLDLAALALEHNSLPVGQEVVAAGLKNLPQSARVLAMGGILEARAGQPDKAQEAFSAASKLDPSADFGPVGLAVTLLENNAPNEAARVLREQLRKPNPPVRARLLLAQALQRTGAPTAEVKNLLAAAIAADPSNAEARQMMGKALLDENALPQAIVQLESALRLDPKSKTAAYQLLTAYRRAGRNTARAALEQKVKSLLDAERDAKAESGRYRLVRAPDARHAERR